MRRALEVLVATIPFALLVPRLIWLCTWKLRPVLRSLLRHGSRLFILIVGVATALSALGLAEVAAFGAGFTGAFVAVSTGLLAQSVLAGAWIAAERDFEIGDDLELPLLEGVRGIVSDITARAIELRSPDASEVHLIPTSLLLSQVLTIHVKPDVTPLHTVEPPKERQRLVDWLQAVLGRDVGIFLHD